MCFSDLPYVSPDQQVDCSARPVYVEPYRRRRSSTPQLAFVRYRRGSRRSPIPWERGDLRYQWDGQAWILHRWSVRHFCLLQIPTLEVMEGSVFCQASCLGGGGGSGESPGQCQVQSWRDALRLSHIFPRILNGLDQIIELRFHRICLWLWPSRPVGIFHTRHCLLCPFPDSLYRRISFLICRTISFISHPRGRENIIFAAFGVCQKARDFGAVNNATFSFSCLLGSSIFERATLQPSKTLQNKLRAHPRNQQTSSHRQNSQ